MPSVRLEEPIDVTFDSFHKRYFIDVLAGDGGIFEVKSVAALAGRHRAQLLQYLMLAGASHGKLINVRPESIEHEFVNTTWTYTERTSFELALSRWESSPACPDLPAILVPLLRDLGIGLELSLYEEAIAHFLGPQWSETACEVQIDGRRLGQQRFRLVAPRVAIKLTALDDSQGALEAFESDARRLLTHTDLRSIAWVNIHTKLVTFTTLSR